MYEKFREAAVRYDERNYFSPYNGNLNDFPSVVHEFYRILNPVDVEIDYDGLAIRFCPAERLVDLQKEYSHIDAQFVFATCNGDPIFISDETVYTCPHDSNERSSWEKLADSFGDYIKKFELQGDLP